MDILSYGYMVDKTRFLKLKDLRAYVIASKLAHSVWLEVSIWPWFEKRTLGTQLVEAVDSIAANIAEGFGRYHKKDKMKFYYNARGSVFESAHWVKQAFERKLIQKEQFELLIGELRKLPKEINHLIHYTQTKLTI